ncbi:MAG: carbohydrate kinase family protein [Candidatus Nezhaarchaeales archaeon]
MEQVRMRRIFDLVAIGNPVYDIIKTPLVESLGRVLSGCSVNAALTAKKLGMDKVALVGCIGEDFEERFIREMKSKNIQLMIVKRSKKTTGFKLKYLDFSGNRELEILGLSDGISKSDIPEDAFNTKAVIVGPVIGEVGIDVPAAFKERGVTVFLDPQGYLREISGGVVQHYSNPVALEACCESHVVKPNMLEAKLLSGFDEPIKAATSIYEKTGAMVAVTLAEKGSIIVHRRRAIIVPAYPTYPVDPTGAGDVYLGAFAYYLSIGLRVEDAASYASAVASIKVENIAGHFNISLNEVTKRALWIRGRVKVKKLS